MKSKNLLYLGLIISLLFTFDTFTRFNSNNVNESKPFTINPQSQNYLPRVSPLLESQIEDSIVRLAKSTNGEEATNNNLPSEGLEEGVLSSSAYIVLKGVVVTGSTYYALFARTDINDGTVSVEKRFRGQKLDEFIIESITNDVVKLTSNNQDISLVMYENKLNK